MNRRQALRLGAWLGPAVAVAGAAGCAKVTDETAGRYHHGELRVATGNTTGVFYEIGAGYADLISQYIPGYQAVAAPTAGSVDNLNRLARGDCDLALILADSGADAFAGNGTFTVPIPVRALSRLYSNLLHVMVRADGHITSVAGLRGKRVSTGTKGSGTAVVAGRVLAAAGLDATKDIVNVQASLPESTAGLISGQIDALFWSGGLPTPGITDLVGKFGDGAKFLDVVSMVPAMQKEYGTDVYTASSIPSGTYGSAREVPAIAQPNLLVARPDLPEALTYQLTQLLFAHRTDLIGIHSAAKSILVEDGPKTAPIPLADGAARYYRTS